jgi:hypothetical protein
MASRIQKLVEKKNAQESSLGIRIAVVGLH